MHLSNVDVSRGLTPELHQADCASKGRPLKVAVHVFHDGVPDLEQLVANSALVVGRALVLLDTVALKLRLAHKAHGTTLAPAN